MLFNAIRHSKWFVTVHLLSTLGFAKEVPGYVWEAKNC